MANVQDKYRSKLVTPQEAVKVVKSYDMVQYNSYNGVPPNLDQALAARRDELQGVVINTSIAMYPLFTITSDPSQEHFIYDSWHASAADRKLAEAGNFFYVPFLYYEMPLFFERESLMDVTMLQVSPMDELGYFNLGPSVGHAKCVLDTARTVIVEVNQRMPVVCGESGHQVHIDEVDLVVEGDNQPLFEIPVKEAGEVDRKVAGLVMEQIEDGACLQLGIGAMPNAVGQMIADSDLQDLGVHTEMMVDAYVKMAEAGRVTGKRKVTDPGKMTFTFALGTQALYDYIDRNPVCMSRPVIETNRPDRIALNPKVIAINNAIEIDLFSQINSESSGTRHISGTGGQVDFMLGAYMSQGGKGIICMSSTFTDKKGNLVSRIRPTLSPGTIVTVPRTIAHWVITEYGAVSLKGRSTWQRAEAVVSIAHPQFRDDLIKEAQQMGIWRRTNRII